MICTLYLEGRDVVTPESHCPNRKSLDWPHMQTHPVNRIKIIYEYMKGIWTYWFVIKVAVNLRLKFLLDIRVDC